MESHACPKCNTIMDEGYISWPGSSSAGYISQKQTGMIRRSTAIKQARACPNCGYVEMYIDPNELKRNIS